MDTRSSSPCYRWISEVPCATRWDSSLAACLCVVDRCSFAWGRSSPLALSFILQASSACAFAGNNAKCSFCVSIHIPMGKKKKCWELETDKWNVIKSSPGKCQVGWNPAYDSLQIRFLLAGPLHRHDTPRSTFVLPTLPTRVIPVGMTEEWISHGIIPGWSAVQLWDTEEQQLFSR